MEKFKEIFSGLERAYGMTYVDKKGADGQKIKGKSFVQRGMVTDSMWQDHLNGAEPSLGIIPINEDNTCKWGCVDIDSYAGFDHKKYCFNDQGEAVNLERFYLLHDLYKLTPEQLEVLIIKRPDSEFSDGPPCLESLTQTEIKDGRDRIIYQYIQYAKRKWPDSWQAKINAFNYKYFEKHPSGPLEDRIVQGKIKFNDGKDLGFKCNEDPMCNHCDKKLCRTRKYGIGGDAVFPILSDLQKVELDEPYYWVNVDGDRVKLDNIDCLMEQRLFRRTVVKQINKKPPRITVKEFEKYTDMLLQGIELIKAPVGSSMIDQLKEHKFIFHKFYHGHLLRKKWPEKPQVTQQMLKEYCECSDDRIVIGKKRPTIMVVDAFEKPDKTHTPKTLKEKDPY